MAQAYLALEDQELSAISRLFSTGVVKEFARKGKSPLFARLVNQLSGLDLVSPENNVSDVFDNAFSLLKMKKYRHEYVYKAALTHKILLGVHSLQTATMLNEFRVGSNIADTVILNGTSTVYEIKSERDSLSRLTNQVDSYGRVFAKVNVITGLNHLDAVCSQVPESVGVMCLSDRYQISTVREAKDNSQSVSTGHIFEVLQQKEVVKVLQNHGLEIPNVPNTEMYAELQKQFLKLSPFEAHRGMVDVLRSTRNHLALVDLIESIPQSLQSAVLSSSFRKKDHERLSNSMSVSINEALNWI